MILKKDGELIYLEGINTWRSFSEGLALARKTVFVKHEKNNSKIGNINEMGNWQINPDFENAYSFKNRFAIASQGG